MPDWIKQRIAGIPENVFSAFVSVDFSQAHVDVAGEKLSRLLLMMLMFFPVRCQRKQSTAPSGGRLNSDVMLASYGG